MLRKFARTIVPANLWNQLRRLKPLPVLFLQWAMARLGYTVARLDDYYSPLPYRPYLRQKLNRWHRPSALAGIAYDLDGMKVELVRLLGQYGGEFSAFPPFRELKGAGYGPGFTEVDALTLYLYLRDVKPRRYMEIGSGLSTYYCSLAAAANTAEGHPLEITCIEPHPFGKLYSLPNIQVIPKEVQDLDAAMFHSLGSSDVLFIDSSHVLKIDGDVPYLYLEALPGLRPGVLVHVHDVPFPYNTPFPPEHRIFERPWPRLWTEAMVVQAFLSFNPAFQIVMSLPLIRFHDEAFLRAHLPNYESLEQNPDTFSSLWLRRVA